MQSTGRQQADVFADVLHDAGVEDVFTLCGNHLLDAYRALVDRGINLVGVRSEGAAVMAADGYARATRRLGVALVTGGPGHTNGVTGLATAQTSSSPVLLVSGSSDVGHRGDGAHQELDQVAGVAAYTKWAGEALTPAGFAGRIADAIVSARSAPTGATHLSVPLDVMGAPAGDVDVEAVLREAEAAHGAAPADPEQTARFVEILTTAERPVLLFGAGAYFERAEEAIAEFGRTLSVPIFTLDSARGVVPDDDLWNFGYPDPEMNPKATAIADADVVVLCGHRIDFRFRYGGSFPAAKHIVEINPDPQQLGAVQDNAVQVPGSTAGVLGLARQQVPGSAVRQEWLRAVRGLLRRADVDIADVEDGGEALDPEAVARVLRDHLPASASVALDSGDFVQWCRAVLRAAGPGQWLRPGRMSTCGAGLPLALGAAIGRRQPSVVVVGDGSLGYHVAELETAARYGLPLLCVVGDNQAWGLELNLQNAMYDERYGEVSTLSQVDYPAIAAGFGVEGHHVPDLGVLAELVDDFAHRPRPLLIEVPITLRPSPVTRAIIERGSV